MLAGSVAPARPHDGAAGRRRRLVRVDAGFEAVLGAVLMLSPSIGLHKALGLPAVASAPVVAGFGVALLPVAFGLWRAARVPGPSPQFVRALALLNFGGALAFGAWPLVARDQFAALGAVFVSGIALALAGLAITQAQAALRR